MDAPPVQYVKTTDGYDIAYSVCGEGRPLVLMQDICCSSTELLWRSPAFRGWFEQLASRFQLIQFDSRGGGNSTRGLKPGHSCEDYVLDLEAVANRLGLNSLVLAANVLSAHVAIRYVARHPDTVTGLILLNPTPMEGAIGLKNWEGLYKNSWENFVRSWTRTFSPQDGQDWADYIRNVTSQTDFLLMAESMIDSRVDELLSSIRIPTLVMAVREPPYNPLTDASRAYASAIPNARLVLFDGGYQLSVPSIQIVEDFINALPEAGERLPVEAVVPNALSGREAEVLRLLAQGRSNPQIAEALFITRNTVQNHVSSILIKLNLQNRAQAAVYAKEHGIV